jgi:hypothetical protein
MPAIVEALGGNRALIGRRAGGHIGVPPLPYSGSVPAVFESDN